MTIRGDGHPLHVEAIALWAPIVPGWAIARAAFRGDGATTDPPAKRPAPALLPSAERRRAPDSVALALEVASAAVERSGRAAADLQSVFVSAHADLGINDYMCTTLANEPTLISPTKFHNSVHNAASGYWTIATGCHRASTALTAFEHSFAAGLLEAAMQCAADSTAVLLVGCDVGACGALASVTRSEGLLAVALVLAPEASERTIATIHWALKAEAAARAPLRSKAALALAGNALADALPLAEGMAHGGLHSLAMPLSASMSLQLCIEVRE